MRRQAWIAALLFLCPLAAHATWLIALTPADNGGLTAFVAVASKAVYAIPIDSSGASHPERATLIATGVAPGYVLGVGRSAAGYAMSYRDAAEFGYFLPLAANFSLLTPPQALGKYLVAPIVCNGDVCAIFRTYLQALVFLDPKGEWIRQVQLPPSFLPSVSTAGDGFAVAWETRATDTSPWDLHIEFVSRAGQITGTSVIATNNERLGGITIVPHPLGVAAFWPDKKQIRAAVVHTDGTVAATATYPTPDLELSRVSVAYNGGQFAIGFDTYLAYGGPAHTFFPALFAAYLMRVSESLAVVEGPVRLAPSAVDSGVGPIAANGDAFFARWYATATDTPAPTYPAPWPAVYEDHLLRIALTGPIEPAASVAFNMTPVTGRRRSVNR